MKINIGRLITAIRKATAIDLESPLDLSINFSFSIMSFQPGLHYQAWIAFCGADLKCNQKAVTPITVMPLLYNLEFLSQQITYATCSINCWVNLLLTFVLQWPAWILLAPWTVANRKKFPAHKKISFQLNKMPQEK